MVDKVAFDQIKRQFTKTLAIGEITVNVEWSLRMMVVRASTTKASRKNAVVKMLYRYSTYQAVHLGTRN